jgi:hypothetical protein
VVLCVRQLDDAGDTREERQFRMWINSLGIDGVYINNLFSDLSDGVALLKVRNPRHSADILLCTGMSVEWYAYKGGRIHRVTVCDGLSLCA